MTDGPTRRPIAETGMKPLYEGERAAWFYFVYDWETRSKQVFENSDLFAHPEKFPKDFQPNTHVYRLHVRLPPPIAERTETNQVIDIAPYVIEETEDTKAEVATEKVAYTIARHLFFEASKALPGGTYAPRGTGAAFHFGGQSANGTWDDQKPAFEILCPHGKFRVTVEKVD
jgi:hypothetical protein